MEVLFVPCFVHSQSSPVHLLAFGKVTRAGLHNPDAASGDCIAAEKHIPEEKRGSRKTHKSALKIQILCFYKLSVRTCM